MACASPEIHRIVILLHPEFKSKPFLPHPLFASFIAAAYESKKKKDADTASMAPELIRSEQTHS
jgi:hypothetical protein